MTPIPLRHSTVVASSTAQNDAGVFDLSFRDERYMPFEGAGAVSCWRLTLPKVYRQFDYATISDVILTLFYEASESDDLRGRVESAQADEQRALTALLTSPGLPRAYSLRHEFVPSWQRFSTEVSAAGVRNLAVTLTDVNLPYFLDPAAVAVQQISVLVRVEPASAAMHGADTLRASVTIGDQTRFEPWLHREERAAAGRCVAGNPTADQRGAVHRPRACLQGLSGPLGAGSRRRAAARACRPRRPRRRVAVVQTGVAVTEPAARDGDRRPGPAGWIRAAGLGGGGSRSEAAGGDAGPTAAAPLPTITPGQGGGAIRGIGEKFAANPATGTGTLTVPVPVTPGRSGFGPQLNLSYDSGSDNGGFGYGWSLSLPAITRKTARWLPRSALSDTVLAFWWRLTLTAESPAPSPKGAASSITRRSGPAPRAETLEKIVHRADFGAVTNREVLARSVPANAGHLHSGPDSVNVS